jgi:hypothetical protein
MLQWALLWVLNRISDREPAAGRRFVAGDLTFKKKEKAMGDTHGFFIKKNTLRVGKTKYATLNIRASRGCTKIVNIFLYIFFDLQVY